jgi:type VI secretion system FHA domain protein
MREAGRAFGALAEGLRGLLAIRATVKDHARLDRTQIGAAQNNPLKFSINGREAAQALLQQREDGYMAPLAAIEAGFLDLKAHELALLDGLQSAVAELLSSFDPATLEARLADAGAVSLLLQGGRRARLWELYTERYGEIAKTARARFMGHFDGAFRQAYERKSAEVSQASRTPPPGRQGGVT